MEATNENEEQPIVLTKKDLAVASYSISEVFNSYVDRYQSEDYGDMSKEQMETSMNTLRSSFIKFDLVLKALNPKEESVEEPEQNEGG
jgi:1-aminocyclopropane-1-carboxylate deaminase/D-cysteine desulfhydrase-like pyridoxal-dependent ACC family enzyme